MNDKEKAVRKALKAAYPIIQEDIMDRYMDDLMKSIKGGELERSDLAKTVHGLETAYDLGFADGSRIMPKDGGEK